MRPVFAYGGGGGAWFHLATPSSTAILDTHQCSTLSLAASPSTPFPFVPGMMARQRSTLSASMFPGRHKPGITNRAHTGRLHVVRLAHISFSSSSPKQQRLTRQTGWASAPSHTTAPAVLPVLHSAIMTSKTSIPMVAPTRTLPNPTPPHSHQALPPSP